MSKKYKDPKLNTYCCLGVFQKAVRNVPVINTFADYHILCDGEHILDQLLDKTFGKKLTFFTSLNDIRKLSFSEIADAIEKLKKV